MESSVQASQSGGISKPKPGLVPKPRLTPKPFSLQRNTTIHSIHAPKTIHGVSKAKPDQSGKSEAAGGSKPALSTPAPKSPEPASILAKPSSVSVPAKNQPPETKASEALPRKDDTLDSGPGISDPAPQTSAPKETPKSEPVQKDDVIQTNCKPSTEAGTNSEQKDEEKKDESLVIAAQKVEESSNDASSKADSTYPWGGARKRLSTKLTSKFESGGLPLPPKPTKAISTTSIKDVSVKPMPSAPEHSQAKSEPSNRDGDADEPKEEYSGGNSIKRRISLLFDSSSGPEATTKKEEPEVMNVTSGVKERIRNWAAETGSDGPKAEKKPLVAPRTCSKVFEPAAVSPAEKTLNIQTIEVPIAEEAPPQAGDPLQVISPTHQPTEKQFEVTKDAPNQSESSESSVDTSAEQKKAEEDVQLRSRSLSPSHAANAEQDSASGFKPRRDNVKRRSVRFGTVVTDDGGPPLILGSGSESSTEEEEEEGDDASNSKTDEGALNSVPVYRKVGILQRKDEEMQRQDEERLKPVELDQIQKKEEKEQERCNLEDEQKHDEGREKEEARQREERRLREEEIEKQRVEELERKRLEEELCEMERQRQKEIEKVRQRELLQQRQLEEERQRKEQEEESLRQEQEEREKERLREVRQRELLQQRQLEEERQKKKQEEERLKQEQEEREKERLREERQRELLQQRQLEEERQKKKQEEERLRQEQEEREKERLREERQRELLQQRQLEEERQKKEKEEERLRQEQEEREKERLREEERNAEALREELEKQRQREEEERQIQENKKYDLEINLGEEEMSKEKDRQEEPDRFKGEEVEREQVKLELLRQRLEEEKREEARQMEERLREEEREKERLTKEADKRERQRRLAEEEMWRKRQRKEEEERKRTELERKVQQEKAEELERIREIEEQREEEKKRQMEKEREELERNMREELERQQASVLREKQGIEEEGERKELDSLNKEEDSVSDKSELNLINFDSEVLPQKSETLCSPTSNISEPTECLIDVAYDDFSVRTSLIDVDYDDFSVKPTRGSKAKVETTPFTYSGDDGLGDTEGLLLSLEVEPQESQEDHKPVEKERVSPPPWEDLKIGGVVENEVKVEEEEEEKPEVNLPISEVEAEEEEGEQEEEINNEEEEKTEEDEVETMAAEVEEEDTEKPQVYDEHKDNDALADEEAHKQDGVYEPESQPDSQAPVPDQVPDIPFEEVDTSDSNREPDFPPLPESSTPLLDTSAQRSKAALGKRRSRSRPSRSLRAGLDQKGKLDWRIHDSTNGKEISSKQRESDSEEEQPTAKTVCSPSPSSQRVPVFPGLSPTALLAQIKRRTGGGGPGAGEDREEDKRGEGKGTQNEEVVPSPTQLSRSPRSGSLLAGAARVLPPLDAKNGGAVSSPAWLQELKSKKRMSQYEGET